MLARWGRKHGDEVLRRLRSWSGWRWPLEAELRATIPYVARPIRARRLRAARERLAPFHVLATEGTVHVDKPHTWHMETLARLTVPDDPVVVSTPFTVIDLTDTYDQERGISWWREVTDRGGEGVVVKPLDFIARARRGLVQPALKCYRRPARRRWRRSLVTPRQAPTVGSTAGEVPNAVATVPRSRRRSSTRPVGRAPP